MGRMITAFLIDSKNTVSSDNENFVTATIWRLAIKRSLINEKIKDEL